MLLGNEENIEESDVFNDNCSKNLRMNVTWGRASDEVFKILSNSSYNSLSTNLRFCNVYVEK